MHGYLEPYDRNIPKLLKLKNVQLGEKSWTEICTSEQPYAKNTLQSSKKQVYGTNIIDVSAHHPRNQTTLLATIPINVLLVTVSGLLIPNANHIAQFPGLGIYVSVTAWFGIPAFKAR
jgi:hypothetical protein